jgi:MFS family permease
MFFYLINTTFTRTYTIQYGLSSGFVGICYIPQAVGAMLGGIFGGRYSDNLYRRRVAEAGGESWPEMRLGGVLMWIAVLIQGIAFIAYGWCITKDVHFAWGLVCQFFRKHFHNSTDSCLDHVLHSHLYPFGFHFIYSRFLPDDSKCRHHCLSGRLFPNSWCFSYSL